MDNERRIQRTLPSIRAYLDDRKTHLPIRTAIEHDHFRDFKCLYSDCARYSGQTHLIQ